MSSSELLGYFEDRLGEALVLLKRLVEIESSSFDKEGVDALASFLAQEFCSRGAQVETLPACDKGNLLKATWKGDERPRPVMVLGHLDTVWPRGTATARPFKTSEGKAWGPGIFDMKGGILLCLLACRAFQEGLVRPSNDVIFFFTSDEEIGTSAGLPHLKTIAKDCRAVLCLEPLERRQGQNLPQGSRDLPDRSKRHRQPRRRGSCWRGKRHRGVEPAGVRASSDDGL